MDKNEEKIRLTAIEFAKRNKNQIATRFTDIEIFKPDEMPVSVFMAGSPGAGKTEYSKNLILLLEDFKKGRVIRIDPDDIRSEFVDYNGRNSYLFFLYPASLLRGTKRMRSPEETSSGCGGVNTPTQEPDLFGKKGF